MLGLCIRLLWRFFVIALATVIFYFILFTPLPVSGSWQVAGLLLVIYVLVAYVTIPFLVRLWRVLIKPNHIPVYAVTSDGWASDPVNIAIVCKSRKQFIKRMEAAGWTVADPITFTSALKEAYAMLFNKPYPTAPMSSLYLFDRKQDIGFQIQQGNPPTPRHRHHVRFWQLSTTEETTSHTFWEKIFQPLFGTKRQIWIGAATHDIAPFGIRFRNLQLTHKIDSMTDRERDYLINTLEDIGAVHAQQSTTSGHALRFRGQTFGVDIIVDGTLKIVEIK